MALAVPVAGNHHDLYNIEYSMVYVGLKNIYITNSVWVLTIAKGVLTIAKGA
jgi:hypothetical protein